jgi:hypothetical protein
MAFVLTVISESGPYVEVRLEPEYRIDLEPLTAEQEQDLNNWIDSQPIVLDWDEF